MIIERKLARIIMKKFNYSIIWQTFWNLSDRAGRKSQGLAILPSMPVRVSDKILFVYFVLHRKSEMQLVCRNDHGQLELDSASNDIYFLNM